ncbi:unnamed protein product [Citrullus colocynthis]|uniref:Uncharacterized protein n=1 Tax=Citrullus colocynthis TaxID=252529 RepID=A0ABP0Y6C4_9ROSI
MDDRFGFTRRCRFLGVIGILCVKIEVGGRFALGLLGFGLMEDWGRFMEKWASALVIR